MQIEQLHSLRMLRWMMAASLALPVVLFAYLATTTWRATWDTADREIERTLDVVQEHALKVFETIERTLSEVNEIVGDQTDETIGAKNSKVRDRLSNLAMTLEQVSSLWIFDAKGKAIASSIEPLSTQDYSGREYFKVQVDRSAEIYISSVLQPLDPSRSQPFFGISRRREMPDGRFAGVIEASVRPGYFENFYTRTARDPGTFILLGRTDGSELARFPKLTGRANVLRGSLGTVRRSELPVTVISLDDGIERRVAFQQLKDRPIYLAAGIETSAIRARWLGTMANYLMFGVPATTLLFLALWLAMRRTRYIHVMAEKRWEADEATRHSLRLEALGKLTGGVAHDFNNLLTVIRSSVELLERPNLPPERRTRYIAAIADTVDRAAKLTSQLLSYARRQSLKPEVFDVGNCVGSVSEIIGSICGSRIRIEVTLADEPSHVDADATQFESALINIAVNARDAMDGAGALSIRVGPAGRVPGRLPANRMGYVAIAMTDTGKGIPNEQFEHIFEPFFTTKEIGQGTGLGLSQVFGFARQSGGEVIVESEVGRGSTFTMYLPRVADSKTSIASRRGEDGVNDGLGLRVLVVEDNQSVGEYAGDALTARGFVAKFVSDPVAALAELASNAEQFDVVFSDVVMPGMSGLDLAQHIQRRYPGMPVVLTSGYSDAIAKSGSPRFELIHKPYSIDRLAHVLIKAGQERRALRQAPPPL